MFEISQISFVVCPLIMTFNAKPNKRKKPNIAINRNCRVVDTLGEKKAVGQSLEM